MEELSKTNDDTTSINDPDPDLKGFNVPNHTIIVRPLHISGETKGGLKLASKTHHDMSYLMNICKVLKLGDRAYKQEIFEESGPWCKVGDYVLIPKLGGQKVKFKGTPITMISCDQILAVLDNPADIDPYFNIGV